MAGVVKKRDHRRAVLSLVAVATALALTGCAGQAEADNRTGQASDAGPGPKAPRTYTVQELASAIGCTAKITLKALDYRQAQCTHEGIPYVLLDFDTAEGQRAWLDYAEMYGGVYLAGDRWALSAKSEEFMRELSKKLGGTVESHGPGHSAESHSPDHSAHSPAPS